MTAISQTYCFIRWSEVGFFLLLDDRFCDMGHLSQLGKLTSVITCFEDLTCQFNVSFHEGCMICPLFCL